MNDTSKEPLVSITIPTYNRPEELEFTLNCLCNQTYENIKIIVSDNASPPPNDPTAMVEAMMKKDSRIEYYRQRENIGMTANGEFLMLKMVGKYVFTSGDDDWVADDFIAELVSLMEANPDAIMACCDYQNVTPRPGETWQEALDSGECYGPKSFYPYMKHYENTDAFSRIEFHLKGLRYPTAPAHAMIGYFMKPEELHRRHQLAGKNWTAGTFEDGFLGTKQLLQGRYVVSEKLLLKKREFNQVHYSYVLNRDELLQVHRNYFKNITELDPELLLHYFDEIILSIRFGRFYRQTLYEFCCKALATNAEPLLDQVCNLVQEGKHCDADALAIEYSKKIPMSPAVQKMGELIQQGSRSTSRRRKNRLPALAASALLAVQQAERKLNYNEDGTSKFPFATHPPAWALKACEPTRK